MSRCFFFQAEDGIRDWSVTGVQTCALPISMIVRAGGVVVDKSNAFRMDPTVPLVVPEVNAHAAKHHQGIRSEERRVGKECSAGWRRENPTKKTAAHDASQGGAKAGARREDG